MPGQKAEFPRQQRDILRQGKILAGPISTSTYPPSAMPGRWNAKPGETPALTRPLRGDENSDISKG